MAIETIGVVGCGIMGSGIVQACAQKGYQVIVSDTSDEILQKGMKKIDSVLDRAVNKAKLSAEDKTAILARIRKTTDLNGFSAADLVIEAAPEDLELKKSVFSKLDGICPKDTILATNTSVLSVTDMAAVTRRPDKVLGMHFSNPVPVMPILEIVKTIATSEETLATAKGVGENLGKRVVIAQDAPGFISNRILTPFLLNAIRMLESGAATREDIDDLHTKGLGHPMGPLTLLDLIGIDTVYRGASAIYADLKDPQYNPPTLMKKMVTMGWHGRKTGKGFYEYEKNL